MDDDRDDASHVSSFTFDMNLNSPESIDSNDINRQEPFRQALPPNLELIVAERLEFELQQFRAEHARENRRLTDHYRAERDRADRLVDEYLQNEQDRIVEERVQVVLRRIEDERIEEERRLCRIEVECVLDDLLRSIDNKHIEAERLRRIEDERIEAGIIKSVIR